MEKTKQNSTTDYAPQKAGETIEVNFSKTVNSAGVSVYGRIHSSGAETGSISYDSSRGNLLVQLKGFDTMPASDREAVCANAPVWVAEILAEE